MKMPTVIHENCIPYRLPIWQTISLWLFCDRFRIPAWGWGVFWTLQGLIWAVAIVMVFGQKKKMIPGFGEEA